jgi:signal transduction histidine kinase
LKSDAFPEQRSGLLGRLWLRLLVVTVTPVLITVVSVALLANYVTIGQFENFLAQDTQQRDDRLETVLEHSYQEQGGSWTGVGNTVQRMAALVGERLVVTDTGGKVISDSAGQLVDQQQGRNWRRPVALTVNGTRVGTVFINPTLPGRASSLKTQAFLEGVNRSLIIGSVLAVVAGLLLTVLFSNGLRRQLVVVIRVTRQIGRGELSLRIPTPHQGDLADLGTAINHMADDLQRQLWARQQMVADVAHELRNPLQNINGYIEGLKDGIVPADERTLGVLSRETAVLRRLVDDLQDLSLADSGSLTVQLAPVRVQEQIAAIVESMQPRAEELGLELTSSGEDELPPIEADERRLRQVLANLVQNALAYTAPGGRVWINIRPLADEMEITVSDTGTGIAEEDQQRIFDRFYRVDPARARSTGGAGLGLTIARELMHAMDGEIGVTSRMGEGSQFWLRLPLASEPERQPARTPAAPHKVPLSLA